MSTFTIRMEIEVNDESWEEEYGLPSKDLEDYILNAVAQSPAGESGCFTVTGYAFNGPGVI